MTTMSQSFSNDFQFDTTCFKLVIDRLGKHERWFGKTETYIGSQVSRAARIEPVTPPGQIYVTEQFAAVFERFAPLPDSL